MIKKLVTLAMVCITSLGQAYGGERQCDVGLNLARKNVKFISQEVFVDDTYHIFEVPVTDLGLEYYYRVRDNESEQLQEDDIEKLSNAIVAKLIAKLNIPTKPADPEERTEDPESPETPPPTEPKTESEKIIDKAYKILKANCSKCHSGDTINGGLEIVKDNQLAPLNREQKFDVFIAAFDEKMPKGGERLSDDDVIALKEWAKLK